MICVCIATSLLAHLVFIRPDIGVEVRVRGPRHILCKRLSLLINTRKQKAMPPQHTNEAVMRTQGSWPKHGSQVGCVKTLPYTSGRNPDEEAVDVLPSLRERKGCLPAWLMARQTAKVARDTCLVIGQQSTDTDVR